MCIGGPPDARMGSADAPTTPMARRSPEIATACPKPQAGEEALAMHLPCAAAGLSARGACAGRPTQQRHTGEVARTSNIEDTVATTTCFLSSPAGDDPSAGRAARAAPFPLAGAESDTSAAVSGGALAPLDAAAAGDAASAASAWAGAAVVAGFSGGWLAAALTLALTGPTTDNLHTSFTW